MNVAELDKLHSTGGAMPHGIIGTNGWRGSHYYFLNLTKAGAKVVVAFYHVVLQKDSSAVYWALEQAQTENVCVLSARDLAKSTRCYLLAKYHRGRVFMQIPFRSHKELPP